MVDALHRVARDEGSQTLLCKKIGATMDQMNSWLNRGVNVPLEYALEIQRVTNGEVKWYDVAPHLAHFAKRWEDSSIINRCYPIQYKSILLTKIESAFHVTTETTYFQELLLDISSQGLKHPICIDSDHGLIFGKKRLMAYKILHKTSIPACQLSLSDLLNAKYSALEILHFFTISERIAIGLALENQIGKRRGQRNDLELRHHDAKVMGRTDILIASLLGFGSRFSYNQAKKIAHVGDPALIEAVDKKLMSISTGYLLTKLSCDQQRRLLGATRQEIIQQLNILKGELGATACDELIAEEIL